MREWRRKNSEKVLKYNKNWRDKNRKKFREWQRQYWHKPENKIKKVEQDRKWRENNKEKKSITNKNYRATHREQEREGGLKKYYKKKNAEGSFTLEEWEAKKREYNYTCPACGKREPEVELTTDHIIALNNGGTNYVSNIQPLCRSCNSKKHTKTIKYEPI